VYDSILEHFNTFTRDMKSSVLYFLGTAIRRKHLDGEALNRTMEVLLDILRLEDNQLVIVLLETGILATPEVSREHKQSIARDLLRLWELFNVPYIQFAIEDTLLRLGTPGVKEMFEFIKTHPLAKVNKEISPILGENISKINRKSDLKDKKIFRDCLKEGKKLFLAGAKSKGVIAEMMGRACASPLITKKDISDIYTMFTNAEDYAEYRNKILEGLGWLGSSPKVELEIKVELAARFQRLLNIKLPEVKGVKHVEDNINVFVLGAEADLYSDFLPVIIEGLARIGTGVELESPLQLSVLNSILRMWKRTYTWEVILGPAASLALVTGLSQLGSLPDLSAKTKKLILSNLIEWKNQLYVIEAVTRMAETGTEKYKLSALFGEMVEQTLEMLQHENDTYSEKERMTLLKCFSTIIANKRLNPKDEEFNRFVEKGISYLVRGYKEGIRQTVDWLGALGKSTDISKQFRTQIEDILKSLKTSAISVI